MNEGNSDSVESLINFDKLRMLATYVLVRSLFLCDPKHGHHDASLSAFVVDLRVSGRS